MGINTSTIPTSRPTTLEVAPLTIIIKSYIERYDTSFELDEVPDNKIIFKIEYGFKSLKFLYSHNIIKLSAHQLSVDPSELPYILNCDSNELNEYFIERLSLKNSYIHSFRARHTMGNANGGMDITFTNLDKDYPTPSIKTMADVDLMSVLPNTITNYMQKETYADMFGVHHHYIIDGDYMKIFNYLILVNYFNDEPLKYGSTLIIPRNYLHYFPIP